MRRVDLIKCNILFKKIIWRKNYNQSCEERENNLDILINLMDIKWVEPLIKN